MKMRYSLRTLLIVMFLVGPLCVYAWPKYVKWRAERAERELDVKFNKVHTGTEQLPGGISIKSPINNMPSEEPTNND